MESSRDEAKRIVKVILQTEQKIKSDLSNGVAPSDPNLVKYREAAKADYEKLFSLDPAYACENNFDEQLWKRIFYQVIEIYRKKMREISHMKNNSRIDSRPAHPVSSSELKHLLSALQQFIDQASGFYHNLILKIRTSVSPPLDLDRAALTSLAETDPVRFYKTRLCFRANIALGDLARYLRDVKKGDDDWLNCRVYYLQAQRILPSNGAPHNQLAVVAAYQADELAALYHYCRALGVQHPFVTAASNLDTLFEKYRGRLEEIAKSSGKPIPSKSGFNVDELDNFRTRFIAVHCMIRLDIGERFEMIFGPMLRWFTSWLAKISISTPAPAPSSGSAAITETPLSHVFGTNFYAVWHAQETAAPTDSASHLPAALVPPLRVTLGVLNEALDCVTTHPNNLATTFPAFIVALHWIAGNRELLAGLHAVPEVNVLRQRLAAFFNTALADARGPSPARAEDSQPAPLPEELDYLGFECLRGGMDGIDYDRSAVHIRDQLLVRRGRMMKFVLTVGSQLKLGSEQLIYYDGGRFSAKAPSLNHSAPPSFSPIAISSSSGLMPPSQGLPASAVGQADSHASSLPPVSSAQQIAPSQSPGYRAPSQTFVAIKDEPKQATTSLPERAVVDEDDELMAGEFIVMQPRAPTPSLPSTGTIGSPRLTPFTSISTVLEQPVVPTKRQPPAPFQPRQLFTDDVEDDMEGDHAGLLPSGLLSSTEAIPHHRAPATEPKGESKFARFFSKTPSPAPQDSSTIAYPFNPEAASGPQPPSLWTTWGGNAGLFGMAGTVNNGPPAPLNQGSIEQSAFAATQPPPGFSKRPPLFQAPPPQGHGYDRPFQQVGTGTVTNQMWNVGNAQHSTPQQLGQGRNQNRAKDVPFMRGT